MKENKKKFRKIKLIPIFIILLVLAGIGACLYLVSPVSDSDAIVEFSIEPNTSTRKIIENLKKENLIKNTYFTLAYVKINKINSLKAGDFELMESMSLKEIFNEIADSNNIKNKTMNLTFLEGKSITVYAEKIAKNLNMSKDDVLNKLSDKEYLKKLIDKYWFLTDSILNSEIYYPLEGYLAPDTYEFNLNSTVEDIVEKMLDQEEIVLKKYKDNVLKENRNIHNLITLASIVELEGKFLEDRKNIAGVFRNRLNNNDKLGSDVTTYYAFKVDMGERDLTLEELNTANPYNTRSDSMVGKWPVGPICNPSTDSIEASINYTKNDYYYFVADKNSKIYFSKTLDEHNKTIKKLQDSNLWYEYE